MPSSPERPRYAHRRARRRAGATSRATTRGSATSASCCAAVDDRYVIMNAGDELLLRFPAAPPPAPGMVRDFVAVSDGWVKDGDFNTDVLADRAAAADARDRPVRRAARAARGRSRLPGAPRGFR